jgi:hypothetical protein
MKSEPTIRWTEGLGVHAVMTRDRQSLTDEWRVIAILPTKRAALERLRSLLVQGDGDAMYSVRPAGLFPLDR